MKEIGVEGVVLGVSEGLALSMDECLSEIFPIDFSLVEACCFESEVY